MSASITRTGRAENEVTGVLRPGFDHLVHSPGLLGAAVANNASWCDAVCRSHGYPGTFGSRLWTSTGHRLRFYPNAVTLHPEVTGPEVLAAAEASRAFAVKDSFARLDLAPAGFRLLAEASWIARDGAPDGRPDESLSWHRVTSAGELTEWESAWAGGSGTGDGPVFRPGLLSDPRCTVLACRRDDAITAGAVVYAAGGAAGISNLFSNGLPHDRLWAGIQSAVARVRPHLPVVGYEAGASLQAARQAGFRALGTLRIWERPSSAPQHRAPNSADLSAPASHTEAGQRETNFAPSGLWAPSVSSPARTARCCSPATSYRRAGHVDNMPGMGAGTGTEVRLAESDADRDAVFAVRHQVFVTEQSVPEELECDELDARADHFLALHDGVPVGAGRLIIGTGPAQEMKSVGVLGRLAVDRAVRGMGLGKLLVHAIEQRAAQRGLAAVELHAQAHARGFYDQLGYAPYGDLFFEAGIEHISMRKELQ